MRSLSVVGVAVMALVLGSCAPSVVAPQQSEEASAPRQASEVLLVHLLPEGGEAQWFLDGEPIATTSANEAGAYIEIPVMQGTLTAMIDGVEASGAPIESRDRRRYVAYLHEGPGGAPAVVWTPGITVTPRGAQHFRIVNLVPTLSDVRMNPFASCGSTFEIVALPYGTAHAPRPSGNPHVGPTTVCDGDDKIMTIAAAEENDPDDWHVAVNRVKSVVLFQHDGELRVTIVDETPETP